MNLPLDKEQIRHLLREAFLKVDNRSRLPPLSHIECVNMRSRLPMLLEQDLPVTLAQVLEDLLDTHTGRIGDTQDADLVIQWLSVPTLKTDPNVVKRIFGEEEVSRSVVEDEFLRNAKRKAFAAFNSDQAHAIFKWLEYAKTWPELKWYLDDLSAAVQYWSSRAQMSR